jgi:hypothetical protein
LVGEFGFTPAEKIEQVYDAVIEHGVSGALIWSLRFHHRNGGFYWHFEPLGSGLYKAYHWPGFRSGDAYEERRVLDLTRAKAFEIRELDAPPPEAPSAPSLLAIDDVAAISWQGSAGARGYRVERAVDKAGPWEAVAKSVDDTAVQYRTLFNDESAQTGRTYYYRVLAANEGGLSPPSNVVGPVRVKWNTIVDEGRDLTKTTATPGVKPTTGDDRRRREDVHRLSVPAGEALTYGINQRLHSWRAVFFRVEEGATVEAAYSSDGKRFDSAQIIVEEGPKDAGDYGYLQQLNIRSATIPKRVRFIRLQAQGGAVELSRMEWRHLWP